MPYFIVTTKNAFTWFCFVTNIFGGNYSGAKRQQKLRQKLNNRVTDSIVDTKHVQNKHNNCVTAPFYLSECIN